MGMKYKDPVTGQLKEISLKAADTLPIGTIVDYDGEDVPEGWEQVPEYKANPYMIRESRENIAWNITNSWVTMPFATLVKENGDFSSWTYISSGTDQNRIIVGNNASKIRITADVAFQASAREWLMLGLFKNDTQYKKVIAQAAANAHWGICHLEYILDVEEGDIIRLAIYKDVAGTMQLNPLISGWGNASTTTLTIEILED